jgi:uncharacterized Ntn-hydrolase superfamily protein
MTMTLDQIIEAASHLPREQVAEVVDRLTSALHTGAPTGTKEKNREDLAGVGTMQTAGSAVLMQN